MTINRKIQVGKIGQVLFSTDFLSKRARRLILGLLGTMAECLVPNDLLRINSLPYQLLKSGGWWEAHVGPLFESAVFSTLMRSMAGSSHVHNLPRSGS
jgi:hypothetical protein